LAGFLSARLKRCMIPSPHHDDITPLTIFPTNQLVYGRSLGLLPTMVCHIQSGLHTLTELFCSRTTSKKVGRELVFPHDENSPRVELPYGYLMAWFILFCPIFIWSGEKPPENIHYAYLSHFENSRWEGSYLMGVRRLVGRQDSYSLFQCFPYIPSIEYGEEFQITGKVNLLSSWAPSSG